MPMLTIKRMPDKLYRRIKARATAHRRSLNSEILVCLERAVSAEPPGPADVRARLARVDEIRSHLRVPLLTQATLRRAKRTGRP